MGWNWKTTYVQEKASFRILTAALNSTDAWKHLVFSTHTNSNALKGLYLILTLKFAIIPMQFIRSIGALRAIYLT